MPDSRTPCCCSCSCKPITEDDSSFIVTYELYTLIKTLYKAEEEKKDIKEAVQDGLLGKEPAILLADELNKEKPGCVQGTHTRHEWSKGLFHWHFELYIEITLDVGKLYYSKLHEKGPRYERQCCYTYALCSDPLPEKLADAFYDALADGFHEAKMQAGVAMWKADCAVELTWVSCEQMEKNKNHRGHYPPSRKGVAAAAVPGPQAEAGMGAGANPIQAAVAQPSRPPAPVEGWAGGKGNTGAPDNDSASSGEGGGDGLVASVVGGVKTVGGKVAGVGKKIFGKKK